MSDNVIELNTLDPAGFRVPASDAKGHNVRKYIRMQPALASALSHIISSRVFPYKDDAELIRHAIVRHVRWLESIGGLESVSGLVDAANRILAEDQMYEEYQSMFNSLRNRVQDYIQRGEHQEARRVINDMRGSFERMPEGYWKRQYLKQLEVWDWLYEGVQKVNLAVLSNE